MEGTWYEEKLPCLASGDNLGTVAHVLPMYVYAVSWTSTIPTKTLSPP